MWIQFKKIFLLGTTCISKWNARQENGSKGGSVASKWIAQKHDFESTNISDASCYHILGQNQTASRTGMMLFVIRGKWNFVMISKIEQLFDQNTVSKTIHICSFNLFFSQQKASGQGLQNPLSRNIFFAQGCDGSGNWELHQQILQCKTQQSQS